MNSFDSSIISFLNDFVGHWNTFDELMVFMSDSSLVKAGPIMAGLIWLWFRREADGPSRRDYVVATIVTGIVAVVLARLLASALPFRERPMADAAQHFVAPSGAGRDLESWSSFPSDHAILFFTLATGLYQAHRPFGIGAFAWAIVVVCFPRLYLGIHWPTDIIGGAVLGVALGRLGTSRAARDAVRDRLMPWHDAQPAVFYTGLFIVMFEVMNLFEDGREALHFLHHAARNIL